MNVRRLGPGDAAAAVTFVARIGHHAAAEAVVAEWLADERHVMVGAWRDGVPAGVAYGYLLSRPDGQPPMLLLYSIDVFAEHRRRGVGRSLVAAMRDQAPGTTWLVTSESNAAAMALYRSAGGTRPHPDDALWRFPAP